MRALDLDPAVIRVAVIRFILDPISLSLHAAHFVYAVDTACATSFLVLAPADIPELELRTRLSIAARDFGATLVDARRLESILPATPVAVMLDGQFTHRADESGPLFVYAAFHDVHAHTHARATITCATIGALLDVD